jgi:endonuclease YncB( thermonuclease family)
MAKIGIFWDPIGFEIDSLGTHEFVRITDGDTPYISMAVRMLSVDTPESHYPGRENPENHDAKLQELAAWITQGRAPIEPDLAAHLYPKLTTGRAGSLQKSQADAATAELKRLTEERLTRASGRKRPVFLRAANQPFDEYGRLLAYMAPSYTTEELETMTLGDRGTFNLLMVESGWAAAFPIYPSLPKYSDLNLLREAAKSALENARGIWGDPLSLMGYEFRMCYKLWEITRKLLSGERVASRDRDSWITRYCVDMVSREIFPPQEYIKVKAYDRIFIWPQDVNDAVGKLNLIPAA